MNKGVAFPNLLDALETEFVHPLLDGGVLVVESNAGVGKTAFLVQLALGAMSRGSNVLHVNTQEAVEKVDIWYKQLFKNIAAGIMLPSPNNLWDSLLPHRFIMTFKVDGFNLPRFRERANDLVVQKIFRPDIIVVDGLNLGDLDKGEIELEKVKDLARKTKTRIWLAVNTEGETGVDVENPHYEIIVRLQQRGDHVATFPRKGFNGSPSLSLDPITMLMESHHTTPCTS